MIFIKDEEFIRGNCPMTKEEIRILSIAKLEIEDGNTLLDIGAGTGSISVQMAMQNPSGEVVAIEKDSEAIAIIKKNIIKFCAHNIIVVEGEALEVLPTVDITFDGIFVGGSGGELEDIIREYTPKLKPGKKIVLNFITIDNLYKAMQLLKDLGFETECIQVGISKTKGNSYMLFSNNPIFILSGKKII